MYLDTGCVVRRNYVCLMISVALVMLLMTILHVFTASMQAVAIVLAVGETSVSLVQDCHSICVAKMKLSVCVDLSLLGASHHSTVGQGGELW